MEANQDHDGYGRILLYIGGVMLGRGETCWSSGRGNESWGGGGKAACCVWYTVQGECLETKDRKCDQGKGVDIWAGEIASRNWVDWVLEGGVG